PRLRSGLPDGTPGACVTRTVTISSAPSATTGASGVFTRRPPSQSRFEPTVTGGERRGVVGRPSNPAEGVAGAEGEAGAAGRERRRDRDVADHAAGADVDRVDRAAHVALAHHFAAERFDQTPAEARGVGERGMAEPAQKTTHQVEARRQEILREQREHAAESR